MASNKDFHSYRGILTVDAAYSFKNGTGIAIFDEETHHLKTCCLLRPFAPGLENHRATIEMATKVKEFWVENVGFSFDPSVLCIEYPQRVFARNGFMVNSKNIIMLAILCSRIENKFSAEQNLRPDPNEWKGNSGKNSTEEFVKNSLDAWSLKVLKRDLTAIPKHLHHNVYDAVGLGLWAIKKITKNC